MIELAPRTENEMTYDDAILYCTFCTHNGYNDWRLPTRDEYQDNNGLIMSWYINRIITHDICMWCATPVRDI